MEEMAVVNDGAQVRLKEAEQLEMAFMCQKKKKCLGLIQVLCIALRK